MLSDEIILLLPILIWLADSQSLFSFEKSLWWGVFVLSVWVVFIAFFTGHEPLEAEATLPIVCAIWLVWLLSSKPIFNRKIVA
jgi:hypothetical protein